MWFDYVSIVFENYVYLLIVFLFCFLGKEKYINKLISDNCDLLGFLMKLFLLFKYIFKKFIVFFVLYIYL